MMDITGNNLSIVIECENSSIHSWMSFASWYSMVKKLPDADITVACKRGNKISRQFFIWPRLVEISFFMYENSYHLKTEKEIIKIPPSVMALREYDPQLVGPVDVRSDNLATFVDYSGGCGKFVMSEWINKEDGGGLLRDAISRFALPEMSLNETKLLALWEQSFGLYAYLEGGSK